MTFSCPPTAPLARAGRLALVCAALAVSLPARAEEPPPYRPAAGAEEAVQRIEALGGAVRRVSREGDGLEVDFRFARDGLRDAHLRHLHHLSRVTVLRLEGAPITDAGLKHVGRLPDLERLSLARTSVTDAGMKHLVGLEKLERLDLHGTSVGDAGVAVLARLPALEKLWVWKTEVSPAGIARLKEIAPEIRVVPDPERERRRVEAVLEAAGFALENAEARLAAAEKAFEELPRSAEELEEEREKAKKRAEEVEKEVEEAEKAAAEARKEAKELEEKAEEAARAAEELAKKLEEVRKRKEAAEAARKEAQKLFREASEARKKLEEARLALESARAQEAQARADHVKFTEKFPEVDAEPEPSATTPEKPGTPNADASGSPAPDDATPVATAKPVTFQEGVRTFLEAHCFDCHGPEKQKARVRFDRLEGFRAEDRHLWTLVHEKLSAGEMPPESRARPGETEKRRVLSWIEEEQRALQAGSTRRLNRRELSAAFQDLTGLSVDFAAALPGDGKVSGFDTGAEALQDSADSVARVLEVTRRAVEGIRFLEPAPGKTFAADLRAAEDPRKAFDHWKDEDASVKVRGIPEPGKGLLIEPKWLGDRGGLTFYVTPPADGEGILRLKLAVSAVKGDFEGIPNPHLWVEVGGDNVDYREVTAAPGEPHELVYDVQLDDLAIETRGLRITLSHRIEIPYAVEGFENDERSKPEDNVPGGTGLFRPDVDKKELRKLPPEERPFPYVVLERIEIEPGHVAVWPPAGWEADIGSVAGDDESVRRLLDLWIDRAWRRPVSDEEKEPFLALYRRLREEGMSFDGALRAAFQSVLLSAPFRYLASPSDPDAEVADHAVASRLSFMLTGGPPDAELRRLAAAGKIRHSAVLDAQADRLLDGPRSDGFLRPFVTQWLVIGQPITIAMDHIKKQDFRFGRYLKASMREETIAYIGELVARNRPARELIVSDWTMMNNSLAIHYGYDGIEGGHLRRVKLRDDDPRGGGILGHAGIQSMLCWMGENWLIYRGAWTLRHILDDPPPPPPLEVPELIPSDGENRGKTFRELLAEHQEDEKCSVCHESIDPLGFAFQNFDLSGRWREVEYEHYVRNELDGKIEWRGVGETRPVDAAGRLPRGEEFTSFAELKELIVTSYLEDLVRGLMKNLVIWSTGRKPNVADMAEIRAIMEEEAPRGYPLRDLVKAIVRSRAFIENGSRQVAGSEPAVPPR